MTFEEFIRSKKFKIISLIAGGIILLAIVFGLGVFAGLEKADFSYRFSDNYFRTFGGPPGPGSGHFFVYMDRGFKDAHGTDGQILKISGDTVTIKARNGVETNILVKTDTSIKSGGSNIQLSDLKVNDNIVVIGSPDDQGQVQAKLIRVLSAGTNQ